MSDTIHNVALIGASGNLGPSVLQEFLKSPFKVTVLSRPSSKSTWPEGVNVVKTDYSPESLAKALAGQDAVVSFLGLESAHEQLKHIDAAIKAGVRRYIPSEFGHNTSSEVVLNECPPLRAKRAIVDYLKTKESDAFSWTATPSGPLADLGLKIGFLSIDTKDLTATLWDGGNTPFTSSSMAQVGRGLVAILSPDHIAETRNKYVFFESFTVSQNDVIAEIEKQSGKKVKIVEEKKAAAVIEASLERLRNGDQSAAVPLLMGTAYDSRALIDNRKLPGGLWNDRLGLKPESLESVVQQVLASR